MQAHEILACARNADDARDRAIETEHAIQHVPADELDGKDFATLYKFADDSVLAVHGSQVNAYYDIFEAASDLLRRGDDQ
jgi:hypothetical protein